ncbi:MAG TPA: hypothetical protein PK239_00480 [Chitinophagales bacterium]|nr:hypothetical protein [Chitinophagales bacterium]
MKVIAKRTVKANTVELYAEISLQTKRTDIQNYLQQLDEGKIDKTARENKSILHHLQVIGILNHQHELTQYGKRVKENGSHYQKEAGIYQFTLLLNDPLVNEPDILSVERVRPKNSENGISNLRQIDLRLGGEYEVSIVESGKNQPLKKIRLDKMSEMGINKESENLSLHLEWGEEGVYPKLSVLRQNKTLCKIYTPSVQLNSFMEDFLPRRQMKWVEMSGKRRAALEFDDIKERTSFIENFEIPECKFQNQTTELGKFDEIKITGLLICPLNNEKAKLWMESLLSINIKKGFTTPEQFNNLVYKFKKHEVLSQYNFNTPNITDMLELLPTKEKHNLAAPYDLNPTRFLHKSVQSQAKPITIVPDEEMSMRQVLSQLKPKDKLLGLFYYDSYVYNDFQQKCFIEFTSVLTDNETKVYLYTRFNNKNEDNKNMRSKYIAHVAPSIKEIDIANITTRSNHDRYLIMVTTSNEILVYKFSNSIDFISYPKNSDFTADTLGRSKDLSIIAVEQDSIRKDIRNHIQNQVQSLLNQK